MGTPGKDNKALRIVSSLILFMVFIAISSFTMALTLDEVIRLSSQVPEVKSAYHSYKQSLYSLDALRKAYAPNVQVFYNYLYSQPEIYFTMPGPVPISVPIFYAYNYQWGWRVTKLLYYEGLDKGIKAKEKEVQSRYLLYISEKRKARLEAISKFLDAFKLRSLLDVADTSLRLAEEVRKTTEELYKAGVTSKYDYLNSLSLYREAEAKREEALKANEIGQQALLSFLGYPDGEVSLEFEPLYNLKPDELTQIAERVLREARGKDLDDMPSVLALKLSIKGLEESAKAKRKELSPKLTLLVEEDNQRGSFLSKNWKFNAVLSLSIPLYDGGASEIQARSLEEGAKSLESKLERVMSSLKLARISYRESLRTDVLSLRSALARLKVAEEGYKIAVIRYKNGLGTQVELINSQRELVQAKWQVASLKAKLLKDLFSYLHYLGYEVTSFDDLLRIGEGIFPPLVTTERGDRE